MAGHIVMDGVHDHVAYSALPSKTQQDIMAVLKTEVPDYINSITVRLRIDKEEATFGKGPNELTIYAYSHNGLMNHMWTSKSVSRKVKERVMSLLIAIKNALYGTLGVTFKAVEGETHPAIEEK